MKPVCRNRLTIDYTASDAIEDLELAIRKAELQRNKEPARNGFRIWRKW